MSELLNRPCGGRFGDVVESIGNTPLVELPRITPNPNVRIYAKLEGRNPTGSVKDRVARSMIEAAEAEGLIEPGQTILEPTSGNTGISLAMICSRKGYPLKVVMPDNVTKERTQLLEMYGAEIVYSEGAKGSNGAVEVALEMAEDPGYYMPYQYGNEANPLAHYNGTAVEILEELDEVTAFVAGLGTGGTLMGNGRRLKEENPDTLLVAAEPMQGEMVHGLRSLDDGFIPPIIDITLLDRKIMVSNRDAIVWTRKLLDEEGVFAGVSSGAIARIAARIAEELDGGNVVFLIPDDGWKYLSSASTPARSTRSRIWTPRFGGSPPRRYVRRPRAGARSCGHTCCRGAGRPRFLVWKPRRRGGGRAVRPAVQFAGSTEAGRRAAWGNLRPLRQYRALRRIQRLLDRVDRGSLQRRWGPRRGLRCSPDGEGERIRARRPGGWARRQAGDRRPRPGQGGRGPVRRRRQPGGDARRG